MSAPIDVPSYTGPYTELFERLPEQQQAELSEIYTKLDALPAGLSITVGNLKGGVSKTTTVMYLALMLGLKGDSVLVVDSDATNRSALLWSAASAEWPDNVVVKAWAGDDHTGKRITGRDMVERVRAVRGRYRHLLVDTGPQMREYLAAALKVTQDFIVCSSPYPLDTQQIMPSVDLAAEVESMKDGPLFVTVLMSKARKGTISLREALEDLSNDEVAYFDQPISQLETYALGAGSVPSDFREYIQVLGELVDAQEESE
ncbi:AAA family ATPase [Actinomadura napierensis]|uniref:AAA domain-containing protein n=1 Tax=Actinomadura napierensis TaxID=267854 RepID=A0ABP5M8V8_9ACTN